MVGIYFCQVYTFYAHGLYPTRVKWSILTKGFYTVQWSIITKVFYIVPNIVPILILENKKTPKNEQEIFCKVRSK